MSRREQVYRFFIRRGCTAQDAEDLTQEVYLRLYRAGHSPNDVSSACWIRTCQAVLADHLRWLYRERGLFVPLDTVPDCPAPEQGLCEEEGVFLQECLQVLSGKQRQVVQMYFEQEMSVGEIAEAMHRTPSAVRKLLRRAIICLRKHFNVQDNRGGGRYTIAC